MTTLSVTIDDRQAEALKEKAAGYGIKPEELLAAVIRNLLMLPESHFAKLVKNIQVKKCSHAKKQDTGDGKRPI